MQPRVRSRQTHPLQPLELELRLGLRRRAGRLTPGRLSDKRAEHRRDARKALLNLTVRTPVNILYTIGIYYRYIVYTI